MAKPRVPRSSSIRTAPIAKDKRRGADEPKRTSLLFEFDFKKKVVERMEQIATELIAMLWEAMMGKFGVKSEALGNWGKKYEKALYGKLWGSEKKRKAFEFLRKWRAVHVAAAVNGKRVNDELKLLGPLLDAIMELDIEFVKGLVEAMQTLKNQRTSNPKATSFGTGDTNLNKFLLEYAMKYGLIGGRHAPHSVRELNEQHVSRFYSISDKKLRERCYSLGFKPKEDARGRAAERYGKR